MCPYTELEVLHVYELAISTQFIDAIPAEGQPNEEGLVYSVLDISSGFNESFELYKIQDWDESYVGVLKTYKTPFKQQQIKEKITGYIDDRQFIWYKSTNSLESSFGNVTPYKSENDFEITFESLNYKYNHNNSE